MSTYYIYHIDEVPEYLLSKYPRHAIYEEGTLALFGEGVLSDLLPDDIDDFTGGAEDEDAMDAIAERATYTGTPEEREAARIEARRQARIDARIAFRVRMRQATRVATRREIRMSRRQGLRLYDNWIASQDQIN